MVSVLIKGYLHEPMTFAPWNSSGAPLCVVTTNTWTKGADVVQ
jgi:hypothetical protein